MGDGGATVAHPFGDFSELHGNSALGCSVQFSGVPFGALEVTKAMPSLPHQRFTAAGLSEVVTAVVLAMTSALLFYGLTGVQPLGLDFAPIWAASSNPSAAYDAAAITDAQRGILNGLPGLRPFANPPTALLLALPFGLLPFSAAYIAFAAGGFVLFVWTARRAGSPWWVAIAPLVVLLLHIGQMSLVVGGLLLAGLCATDGRIRGLLIGLAAAIKPQLCLFIPLLLLFDRDWRGLAVAAATVGLLSAAATLAFGLDIWGQWLATTDVLIDIVQLRPEFAEKMLQTHYLFAPLAIAFVWLTRRSEPGVRLAAAIGGALLVAPYAMNYELALLFPAVASAAHRRPIMCLTALALGILYPLGTPITLLVLCALIASEQLQFRGRSPKP